MIPIILITMLIIFLWVWYGLVNDIDDLQKQVKELKDESKSQAKFESDLFPDPKFEKKYKIGKYHTLLIQRNGFTLWDDRDGRWILDASTFVSGSEITVVTNKFKQFADKWMHKRTFVLRKPNK